MFNFQLKLELGEKDRDIEILAQRLDQERHRSVNRKYYPNIITAFLICRATLAYVILASVLHFAVNLLQAPSHKPLLSIGLEAYSSGRYSHVTRREPAVCIGSRIRE
jgi:hypothetical protein